MTGTVQWEQLVFIVGLVVVAGGGVLSFALWLWGRLNSVARESDKKISEIEQSHNNLRVKVAEEYVPFSELGKVEARIEGRLSEMAKQFERGFDRMIDILRGNEHHK